MPGSTASDGANAALGESLLPRPRGALEKSRLASWGGERCAETETPPPREEAPRPLAQASLVGAAAGGREGVFLAATAGYFQQHERFGYDPPVDSLSAACAA